MRTHSRGKGTAQSFESFAYARCVMCPSDDNSDWKLGSLQSELIELDWTWEIISVDDPGSIYAPAHVDHFLWLICWALLSFHTYFAVVVVVVVVVFLPFVQFGNDRGKFMPFARWHRISGRKYYKMTVHLHRAPLNLNCSSQFGIILRSKTNKPHGEYDQIHWNFESWCICRIDNLNINKSVRNTCSSANPKKKQTHTRDNGIFIETMSLFILDLAS